MLNNVRLHNPLKHENNNYSYNNKNQINFVIIFRLAVLQADCPASWKKQESVL